MEVNYNEQMLNYYPEVIKSIREFQKMIEVESLQVEEMHEALTKALGNAYISTADENRIAQWERYLGIVPLPQGEDSLELWLEDRKETILARLYNPTKLNSKSISEIISIFTGGTARSYFKDGVIHILIDAPTTNKQYKIANIEQELSRKIPAHLMLNVGLQYYSWEEVLNGYKRYKTLEWDGNTEGLECYNSNWYRLPDVTLSNTEITWIALSASIEQLIFYKKENGYIREEFPRMESSNNTGIYPIHNGGEPLAYIVEEDNTENLTPGLYLYSNSIDYITAIKPVDYNNTTWSIVKSNHSDWNEVLRNFPIEWI